MFVVSCNLAPRIDTLCGRASRSRCERIGRSKDISGALYVSRQVVCLIRVCSSVHVEYTDSTSLLHLSHILLDARTVRLCVASARLLRNPLTLSSSAYFAQSL